MIATFTRLYPHRVTETLHFALLNRYDDRPFDRARLSGDIYAGEWWECREADYQYALECLPPLSVPGGGFCMSEFITDDVTSFYVRIMGRYFCGAVRMSKDSVYGPRYLTQHIVDVIAAEG